MLCLRIARRFVIRNNFIDHNDHRVTGEVTLDAIYPAACDILNFPEHIAEGLEAHKVLDIYIWGSNQPNSRSISAMLQT